MQEHRTYHTEENHSCNRYGKSFSYEGNLLTRMIIMIIFMIIDQQTIIKNLIGLEVQNTNSRFGLLQVIIL